MAYITFSKDAADSVTHGTDQGDYIWGGIGNDTLSGGAGDDFILGWTDNDVLSGEAGNDTLDGGTGSNILSGGDGNDRLLSGGGGGRMTGGAGADAFVVGAIGPGESVVVEDFRWTEGDQLEVASGVRFSAFEWTGDAVRITFVAGDPWA